MNFFNTYIDPSAESRVSDTLKSTFLSEGKQVKEFESALTQIANVPNPVALNSGTSALHLALVLAGIQPGDEVILPAQTFVATGTVIVQERAVPVFADIDYNTGNISVEDVAKKITSKTKAIIAVDWGGLPVDLEELEALATKHGITLIEDAAHALGATYKGAAIGAVADMTCFSFQAIKHVTTGDGGAVSFKDAARVQEAQARRWFGIDRANSKPSELGEREYDISKVGFKYHLNDYGATLGIANLTTFRERLARRRAMAARYRAELESVPGITLFDLPTDREHAYWLFGFHVERRLDFIRKLKEKGIPTSVVHLGIDKNSLFGAVGDLPNQRRFDETQIHIPLHDGLSEDDIEYIIGVIKQGW